MLIPRGELFSEVPEYVKILNRRTDSSLCSRQEVNFLLACACSGNCEERQPEKSACAYAAAEGILETGRRMHSRQRKSCGGCLLMEVVHFRGNLILLLLIWKGLLHGMWRKKVKAQRKAAFLHTDVVHAGYSRELDGGCYEVCDRIFAVSSDVRKSF